MRIQEYGIPLPGQEMKRQPSPEVSVINTSPTKKPSRKHKVPEIRF